MAIYTAEVDLKTGAVLSAPVRLATPLKNSWLPQYSKDGRRLAFLSSDAVVNANDQRSLAQQVGTRPQPVSVDSNSRHWADHQFSAETQSGLRVRLVA